MTVPLIENRSMHNHINSILVKMLHIVLILILYNYIGKGRKIEHILFNTTLAGFKYA